MEMIMEDLIIRKARMDDLDAIWNNVWRDERKKALPPGAREEGLVGDVLKAC